MNTPGEAVKSLSEGINGQVKALKEKLKEYIKSLPDMVEGVHPISHNCCSVTLSTIAKNDGILCPSYYLNHDTKETLLKLLDKTGIENLNKKIESIIETGKLEVGERQSIKLNPAFVSAVKQMWFGKE